MEKTSAPRRHNPEGRAALVSPVSNLARLFDKRATAPLPRLESSSAETAQLYPSIDLVRIGGEMVEFAADLEAQAVARVGV
jgi:hypothetical protein